MPRRADVIAINTPSGLPMISLLENRRTVKLRDRM